MLIEHLNIKGFRGISNEISLDLTAPLTVLYAPNGTGKTSICDAVEWLLCGSVKRLTQDESVKCKFSPSSETVVKAVMDPYPLKRVLADSGSSGLYRKVRAGDYKLVNDYEILQDNVSALPPQGSSPKAKIDWVRSTRFLESESLRLLIDSDKESSDTRKIIFSSLFGVDEYQKNESELKKILGKLPSKQTIEKAKLNLNTKIKGYEESIKSITTEQTSAYREHAYNLLNNAAEILDVSKITYNGDLQKFYELLEVKHIKSIEALADEKNVLDFICEHLDIYTERSLYLEGLNRRIEDDTVNQIELINVLKDNNAKLKEKQWLLEETEKLSAELFRALNELDADTKTWYQLHSAYINLPFAMDKFKSRKSKIFNSITSKKEEISALNEKISLLDACNKSLPSWRDNNEELRGIVIELEALQEQKPKEINETPLVEQLSVVKSQLDTMQAARKKY